MKIEDKRKEKVPSNKEIKGGEKKANRQSKFLKRKGQRKAPVSITSTGQPIFWSNTTRKHGGESNRRAIQFQEKTNAS